MKKIQFLLTFFAAILLGLTACQHSIDAPVPQEMAEHAFNPIALPSSDIEAKLRAFNDYLNSFQNAKSRDAQGMSTEQVEWNIEALLNATYANAAKGFTSQSVSRDSFLIPLNNSAVSSENVVNAWRSAKSLLHDQYVSVGEAGKHVVMIDISTKTLGSQLQLTVSSFIGINPVQSRTDPFTATDDWWWGKLGIGGTSGKCGNYSGQALGKVAVDRLNEELNARYSFAPTYPIYFTNVEYVVIAPWNSPNPNNPGGQDNYRDCLVFYTKASIAANYESSKCIGHEDMNWYYNNLLNLVTMPSPVGRKPANKVFITSELKWDASFTQGSALPNIYHWGLTYFGIPYTYGNSNPPPPEP